VTVQVLPGIGWERHCSCGARWDDPVHFPGPCPTCGLPDQPVVASRVRLNGKVTDPLDLAALLVIHLDGIR
jgi:hypothetical protein